LALVLAGQAFALSTVAYTVEIGGNPGVATYEAYSYPQYVRGSDANGQTVAVDGIVNWGVVATVSGLHSGTGGGGEGDGELPAGIANAVFTLELKDSGGNTITTLGNAPLVSSAPTTAGWCSLINDGDADGARGGVAGADPLQNAAFPSVFDIGGNGANGGRLFDAKASGGPKMDFFHYPSATGLDVVVNGTPVSPVGCNGKLVGMGAGYSAFLPLAASPSTAGIGLTGTSDLCQGLGERVLFEGQLSMLGLAAGTYTLKVTPGAGTNLIPYAFDRCGPGVGPAAFADKPNVLIGDEITFVIANPCPPLQVVSSVSSRTHGTFGSYDIPAGQVECRTCGLNKLIVVFNQNIELLSGTNSVVPGCGTVVSVASTGNVLTVFLSGVTNAMPCTVECPGICPVCNGNQRTTATLCWRYLIGDVNGNGVVNNSDIILARGALGTYVAPFNFRKDVNCNGVINNSDIILIRGRLGTTVAPCPE
jgi:hypothetical protein